MSENTARPVWVKILISMAVSSLVLFSEGQVLEAHLLIPAPVWVVAGTLIAASWTYVKYARYELQHSAADDCSACGLFGHRLPWVLLIGCGFASLVELSTGAAAICAYAIALALFSLAGSLLLMWFSEPNTATDFS